MSLPVLHWRASAACRVRPAPAPAPKTVEHPRVPVDLAAGEQGAPAHPARHPQKLVPARAPDGPMPTPSPAMIQRPDGTRHAIPLLPGNAAGRAQTIAPAIAGEGQPLPTRPVLNGAEALAGDGTRAAWDWDNIARGPAAVDRLPDPPAAGRFGHGEATGMRDCVPVPQLYNPPHRGVDFSHRPRIAACPPIWRNTGVIASAHPDDFDPARG